MNLVVVNKLVCEILSFDSCRETCLGLDKFTDKELNDFIAFIRSNKLLPLVYMKLLKVRNELLIPSGIFNNLKDGCLNSTARSLSLTYDIKKLLSLFKTNSLDVILLKGSYLAEKFYDTPALRPMCDIDILIKKEDLNKIIRIFLDNGYKIRESGNAATQKFHLPHLTTNNGNGIDLHTDLYQNPFFTWRKCPDISDIWGKANLEKLYNTDVLTLPIEYTIVYLATKIVLDNFRGKLLQLYDVALIIDKSEINWDSLFETARKFSAVKDLYCVLLATETLYHTAIPENFLNSLKPSDFENIYAKYIIKQLFSEEVFDGEVYLAAQLASGKIFFLKIFRALKFRNIYFNDDEKRFFGEKIILIFKRVAYLFFKYKTARKMIFIKKETDVSRFYNWLSRKNKLYT